MRLNKLMLTAALPILGVCMTSCGNKARSYQDVLNHVINKYDDHAIDYVTGDYKFSLNNFGVDLDVVATNAIGIETPYKLGLGLKDTSVTAKSVQGICFSSTALNYVETLYDAVVKLTLENVTKFNLDKFYYINGDELTVKIGTDDSVLGLLITANNALDVAMKIREARSEIRKYIEDIPFVGEYIVELYKDYLVSLSTNSTSTGSCYFELKTDKNGFIKKGSFDFNSKLDVYANVTSLEESTISYTFHLTGDVAISTSFEVNF